MFPSGGEVTLTLLQVKTIFSSVTEFIKISMFSTSVSEKRRNVLFDSYVHLSQQQQLLVFTGELRSLLPLVVKITLTKEAPGGREEVF